VLFYEWYGLTQEEIAISGGAGSLRTPRPAP
jgi:hypothetical protein